MQSKAFRFPLSRLRLGALALALAAFGAHAEVSVFSQPDSDFKGMIRPMTPNVLPGSEVEFRGMGFKPGQKVTLYRGSTALNVEPYVADAEGRLSGKFNVPADAVAARHPIILRASEPDAASVITLKVSKEVPQSGAEKFDIVGKPISRGLYQSAYSGKENALYVTASGGHHVPVTHSELLKVDADSLEVQARVTPAAVPGRDDGHVYAVYGVGVDDVNGHVWVTNTVENTLAVYRTGDLALVKQFAPGALPHGRDVIVDGKRSRVYASPVGESKLAVFDARTLGPLPGIEIASLSRRDKFSPFSLALDEDSGRVYTVSFSTAEVAVIGGASGKVEKVMPLSNAANASGIAYDKHANRILVAAQGSDNLLIIDADSGQTLHDVYVGAGALNVVYDPKVRLAFVSNRGAGTVTVVDKDGRIVANLDGGSLPNHLHDDGRGHVFLVNKARGVEDPRGDHLTRYTLKDR